MGLFLSTIVNKVDRKGRVSVPAQFRTTLAAQSFAGIILYRSFTQPCIEGCGMDFMEQLSDSAQDYDVFSPEQADLSNLIFADSRQLPWDPEGRVVLPEDLLAHANITECAAFVGKGKTFQLWEPAAHEAVAAEARLRARANPPALRIGRRPANPGLVGEQ